MDSSKSYIATQELQNGRTVLVIERGDYREDWHDFGNGDRCSSVGLDFIYEDDGTPVADADWSFDEFEDARMTAYVERLYSTSARHEARMNS